MPLIHFVVDPCVNQRHSQSSRVMQPRLYLYHGRLERG